MGGGGGWRGREVGREREHRKHEKAVQDSLQHTKIAKNHNEKNNNINTKRKHDQKTHNCNQMTKASPPTPPTYLSDPINLCQPLTSSTTTIVLHFLNRHYNHFMTCLN